MQKESNKLIALKQYKNYGQVFLHRADQLQRDQFPRLRVAALKRKKNRPQPGQRICTQGYACVGKLQDLNYDMIGP